MLTNNAVGSIKVPAIRFEEVIALHHPNALIMDVEGAECELLTGAGLADINKILVETHYRYAGREKVDRMVLSLLEQGFRSNLRHCVREMLFFDRG
jgi:hypothetical protein